MARDDDQDKPPLEAETDGPRRRVLGRLARRLMDPRELGGDAMEALGAILETSDRAKTEMVRMLAREARNYLEELRLKEDLHHLVTTHSLEMKVSLSLKPLAGVDSPEPSPGGPEGDKAEERSGSAKDSGASRASSGRASSSRASSSRSDSSGSAARHSGSSKHAGPASGGDEDEG